MLVQRSKETIGQWLLAIEESGRGLTKWEESFIESIADQFASTESISDRQEEILERIYVEKVR
jgi:hypothetical protein